MSDIWRMTASVRSSVAPSGNCAKLTRYCLSCVGTKPGGTALEDEVGAGEQPEINDERERLEADDAAHAAAVDFRAAAEDRVEAAEEPAEARNRSTRVSQSFFAPCGLAAGWRRAPG